MTITKDPEASESDKLIIYDGDYYNCYLDFPEFTVSIESLYGFNINLFAPLFTEPRTILPEDLETLLRNDSLASFYPEGFLENTPSLLNELKTITISYSPSSKVDAFSFYSNAPDSISTSYADLVFKVYGDSADLNSKVEANAASIATNTVNITTNTNNIATNTEAITNLNTSLEEVNTSVNTSLEKVNTSLDQKLNKVSANGFLYSKGTTTPNVRTDVITLEENREIVLVRASEWLNQDQSEGYLCLYPNMKENGVTLLNPTESPLTINTFYWVTPDDGYYYDDGHLHNTATIEEFTLQPQETYYFSNFDDSIPTYSRFSFGDETSYIRLGDHNGEYYELKVYLGKDPVMESEVVNLSYKDLVKKSYTNESNIATLTETVADHEERVTKVETFFETADGETLDTALDTLVEIQKYITDEGSAADEMVKDIADHEERIKAIEDAPYATTANVATAKGEAIADAEGKVNALKTGVEDGTVVAAKATEASDYTADGAIDTAIKAASKAGTDAAAAVEAGVKDGTIVAAKATVADTANDLSAALDEEIAGLIATAKSGAEETAAADAKAKADAALEAAKAYADANDADTTYTAATNGGLKLEGTAFSINEALTFVFDCGNASN